MNTAELLALIPLVTALVGALTGLVIAVIKLRNSNKTVKIQQAIIQANSGTITPSKPNNGGVTPIYRVPKQFGSDESL